MIITEPLTYYFHLFMRVDTTSASERLVNATTFYISCALYFRYVCLFNVVGIDNWFRHRKAYHSGLAHVSFHKAPYTCYSRLFLQCRRHAALSRALYKYTQAVLASLKREKSGLRSTAAISPPISEDFSLFSVRIIVFSPYTRRLRHSRHTGHRYLFAWQLVVSRFRFDIFMLPARIFSPVRINYADWRLSILRVIMPTDTRGHDCANIVASPQTLAAWFLTMAYITLL